MTFLVVQQAQGAETEGKEKVNKRGRQTEVEKRECGRMDESGRTARGKKRLRKYRKTVVETTDRVRREEGNMSKERREIGCNTGSLAEQ